MEQEMARRSVKSRAPRRSGGGSSEQAYPSSPTRPPKINVWLKFGEDFQHLQVHALCARWAAIKFMQMALNEREFEDDPDENGWYTTNDEELKFKLTGDVEGLLDELDTEVAWEVPQPDHNHLLRASGQQAIKHVAEAEPEKPNRVQKRRSPSAPPVSRDGLVTLAEICAELKIEPRDARKTLRNKVEKPDAGWAWPADEAKKVRAILK